MFITGATMFYLLKFWPLAILLTPESSAARSAQAFEDTIHSVESMVHDQRIQRLANTHGLSLVNVTWEDTARHTHSVYGPNISDMTIGVRDSDGKLHPMPVFRFDNYTDKTADLNAKDIWIRTGNETGKRLQNTRLVDVLSDIKSHLSRPQSFVARQDDLTAINDSHYLVSAQACFLPISKTGTATFTPVIYNYQSRIGAPAVLTLVATREGTSIQVVENNDGYMSEVLYFNKNGQRAPFTATRLSTFKDRKGDAITSAKDATEDGGSDVVLIIQVPLKTRPFARGSFAAPKSLKGLAVSPPAARVAEGHLSDVETAVIGHGKTEGRFDEINGLNIERDSRFPIRITAQFYKATSNGIVTSADVAELRQQIDRVYDEADFVGSLVMDTSNSRPTSWTDLQTVSSASLWSSSIWTWHKSQ
jgi:hypothetical protein